MEPDKKKEIWWKPGLEIFGKVSTWIVIPIVLALIIGKWLDGHFGTKPWMFLSLTLVAFLISCFGIVKTIRKYIQKIEKNGKN